MVQEIHQVLMDREDTCHRTCFSLHLDGNMLDHFSELRSVEGLQEGSVLRVVEGLSGNRAACQGRAPRGRARQCSTHAGWSPRACGGSGGISLWRQYGSTACFSGCHLHTFSFSRD